MPLKVIVASAMAAALIGTAAFAQEPQSQGFAPEQVKAGAGCIKLMASEGYTHPFKHRPGLSVDEMRAAVDEAHRLQLASAPE